MSDNNEEKSVAEKIEEFGDKHTKDGSGLWGYSWGCWIFCGVLAGLIKYFGLL